MPKYKYEWTVEETTTDTRVWTVSSNLKLTDEELQKLACSTEQHPGEGCIEDDSEVTYEETIYGDDAQWDFTLHTTTASIEDELNEKERLLKILKVKDKGEN
jgi:hypothetical protein